MNNEQPPHLLPDELAMLERCSSIIPGSWCAMPYRTDVPELLRRLSDARRERDKARRALREAQWQPIETAPKDGTPVLLAIKSAGGKVWCGWWQQEGSATVSGKPGWVDGSTDRYENEYDMDATHWQPLPEPPTEDAAAHAAKEEK